eukprot:CAMPEP_0119009472 /NCGR_PEP_ID=MMETSP1176-20130426/4385_1 /TAXON_ID=265551 /ORGANISM="Synedropsis recta cf, Strain CCMP1620" /LENGTH=163 /DNA_ID=CAMNT_0006961993 /DNA_START=171 /DNA_END=662 /DNA_ORIENTATION=-
MEALLKLATDSGMTAEQGKTATGGLFAFLKENVPAEQFSQIEEKLPGVDGAVDTYAKERAAPAADAGGAAGMLGSAMSSAGAAGGLAGLMTTLTSKGIDPSMMQKFMPQVSTMVKAKCGIDISQYLGGAATGGGDAAATGETPAAGGVKGLMGKAFGMFGKKK